MRLSFSAYSIVRAPAKKHGAVKPANYHPTLKLASLRCGMAGSRRFKGHPDLISAVNLLMQGEPGWQGCLKIDLFAGDGVVEFQKLGVQEISSIAWEAGEVFKRPAG